MFSTINISSNKPIEPEYKLYKNICNKNYEDSLENSNNLSNIISAKEIYKVLNDIYRYHPKNDTTNKIKSSLFYRITIETNEKFVENFKDYVDILNVVYNDDICEHMYVRIKYLMSNLSINSKIYLLDNEFRSLHDNILNLIIDNLDDVNLSIDYDEDKDDNGEEFDPFYHFFTDCITHHSLGWDTDLEYYFKRLELFLSHSEEFNLFHDYKRENGSFLTLVYWDCYTYDELEEDELEDKDKNKEKSMIRLYRLLNKYSIDTVKLDEQIK